MTDRSHAPIIELHTTTAQEGATEMRTNPITNTEDVIDSRDVIERIDYLETDPESLDDDERDELARLTALQAEGSNYTSEWEYGSTLIRDSYFQDYARELAEDIGAIDREAAWPLGYIDWEAAADALRMDYSSLEFDGETYWVRD